VDKLFLALVGPKWWIQMEKHFNCKLFLFTPLMKPMITIQ